MSLESMISELSRDEKLAAMDLIWRELSREPASYASPEWHGKVISERLANPAPGAALPLEEAESEVIERFDERRAQD